MTNLGGITFGGDARRAHLALIEGGATTNATHGSAAAGSTRAATAALGADPVLRLAGATARVAAATGYGRGVEAPRSRHESGVRSVAATYPNFEDALLPMVLASGVSGEAAAAVADAIRSNPALRAQAERAFQRARIDAV